MQVSSVRDAKPIKKILQQEGQGQIWTATVRLERKEEAMAAGFGRVAAGTEGSAVSSKVTRAGAGMFPVTDIDHTRESGLGNTDLGDRGASWWSYRTGSSK